MLQNALITSAQFAGALVIGAVLALVFVGVTHLLRRYARPILFAALVVAALPYVVFALRAQAGQRWILVELVGVAIYGTISWVGLRGSLWWLAAAWALHPIWDIGLHYFGPGRSFAPPLAYPIPCLSFDLVVAGYVAYLASRESKSAADPAIRGGAIR
jgi:hypothetical protein